MFLLRRVVNLSIALFVLTGVLRGALAQDLEKLYNDSVRSKDAGKAGEDDKNKRYLEWFDLARKNGVSWNCKNYLLFYNDYVFIGKKADGSDIGKKPFDFVGLSSSSGDYIKFTFPALPYENRFELNTKTSELVSYRKTLNQLEKESCQKLSK